MTVEYAGSTDHYKVATVVIDDTGESVSRCIVERHYIGDKPQSPFLTIVDDSGAEAIFLASEIDDIIDALTKLKGEV